ncbi:Hok/Gef family protein [Morganella morganii]
MGLIAVCITVLCFSLLMRDRLCSLNFSNGGTVGVNLFYSWS